MVGLGITALFSAMYNIHIMNVLDTWLGMESWTLGFLTPSIIPAFLLGVFVADEVAPANEEFLWGIISFLLLVASTFVIGNMWASEAIANIATGVGGAFIFVFPALCLANIVIWLFDKNSYSPGHYLQFDNSNNFPIFGQQWNPFPNQFISTLSVSIVIGLVVSIFSSTLALLLCSILGCMCGLINFNMRYDT